MCDRLIQSGRHLGSVCQHVNKVCPHPSLNKVSDIKETHRNYKRLEHLLNQLANITRVYEQVPHIVSHLEIDYPPLVNGSHEL